MKKIVVFTGAGISAESGIQTFRDSGGLWEKYDINEVATPEAWEKNPALVLDFYNQRKQQVINAKPNAAHYALVDLEKKFDVQIITQNIDDLHERAGSKKVLHLHGEIMKARSSVDESLIYEAHKMEIKLGDFCTKGSQLRPHIVWFGELVPNMELAYSIAAKADLFIVIGTSLSVYPAAGLLEAVPENKTKYIVDPSSIKIPPIKNIFFRKEKASIGVPALANELLSK